MSIEEILALPVAQLALPDAHLALWTTAAHMEHALGLMRYWDFTFKQTVEWVKTNDIITRMRPDGSVKHHFTVRTMNQLLEADARMTDDVRAAAEFVTDAEVKVTFGMGHYFRHVTELCLFGVRGSAVGRVHNLPNIIFAPRLEHSAKPEILHQMLERLSPEPRLEMFARELRDDWNVWGNSPNVAAHSIDLSHYQ